MSGNGGTPCISRHANNFPLLTSDVEVARGLVLPLLSELLDLAGVLARVLLLGLLDLQRLLPVDALDEVARVALLDLLAVLVPLDLGVGVVRLALELGLPLRLGALLFLQLLLEAILRVRGCI